ncbi:uncharacterized protein (TIGR02145 family) [Parabacteroides sp. PFB2-10]|uniref:FISUMP domain-containing protein n=1 Tax=Parabacteroides sp. PFB2-10 TaxID=1742405 RepID=UPI0024747624|nr:FISUMP domain-containing protein [Parabacteroides sp. PFB2-10]MDH6312758.1 uncharacterized protein (TIGR02145 family) [Parabacteroides sp. PFB2-10]
MKHFITFTTLLSLVFTLFSCSEVIDGPDVIKPAGEGTALLTMHVGDIRTRADGDFTAEDSEKEIKSLACFVQTYGVGNPDAPEYKPGAFGKYFSTEELRSPMGMEEELKAVGNGSYNVTVRVRSEGFNTEKGSDVIFIANYQHSDPAIDLTDELKALESWEALEAMLTKKVTQSPGAPLLMFARKNIVLTEGKTQISTAEMKRMAVRLDVEYIEKLLDPDDTKKFNLTSVQLIHPKGYSYLLPHDEEEVDQIEVVESFPVVAPATATPDEIKKIYLYPASNREDSEPTRIRIKGTYYNTNLPIDKTIDFVAPDGSTLPLVNNTRYSLQLFPPDDNMELTWKFTVADWSDGSVIEVGAAQDPVEIKEIEFTPAQTTRWDAAKRAFDITGLEAGAEMKFSVEGNSPTTYDVMCLYNKNASSVGISDPADLRSIVTQAAAVSNVDPDTQKTTFTQDYTIAIPSQEGNAQVPVEIKVYIRDAANYNNADSIIFTSLPDYNGIAGLKPVKFAGQYWAPVNVGATTTTSGDNLAFMGYVFQWGRNDYQSETLTTGDHTDIEEGPVSYTDATTTYADKFIMNPKANYDWLIAEDAYLPTRNLLWSKTVNDSPCPAGWRVPRADEWQKIIDAATPGVYDASGKQFTIEGDETGKTLLFPLAGFRNTEGVSTNRGGAGGYWSSSITANGKPRRFYVALNGTASVNNANPVTGFSLRCIQE